MPLPWVIPHVVAPAGGSPGLWRWRFDPLVLSGVIGTALLYAGAFRRVRRTRSRAVVPDARVICFMGGLAVLVVALVSPVDPYAELLLSVHMVQHVLITMVAAPLLVLGSPVTLALAATSAEGGRRFLLRVLHSSVLRVVGFPFFGWVVFAGVMWGWHLPPLYDAALRSDGIHALEHLAFLSSALLFWWPVIGLDPIPARMSHPGRLLYLFSAMPVTAILGVSISSANRILYPFYATASPSIGVSPLSDQHLAGAIMWEGGLLLMLPAMVLVLLDWMRRDERAAQRADVRRARIAGAGMVAEPLEEHVPP